jgi:hypothetical protein
MRALLIACVLACGTVAAPGQKFDEITGTISFPGKDCPVVDVVTRTPEGEFHSTTYWLVFTTQEAEIQAMKLERLTMVKATGKLGGGGQYRYLIVSKLEETK